jgi:sugar lactone lactonase YvrE
MKHLFKIMFTASLLAAEFSPTSIHAAAGDLYDGGLNSHAIYKFTTPAGVQTTFVSNADPNFHDASWLAFDSKGNLFASTATAIAKITPGGTINPSFATGLVPTGLAFDAAGNLYAGDGNAGKVFKITPTGTMTQFNNSPVPGATGLAFDRAGNLYVTERGNGSPGTGHIVKITTDGTVNSFVSTGLNLPEGLAFDSAGNLYEADFGTSTVRKFSSTGSPLGTFGTYNPPLNGPESLAFDRDGNLFVGEFSGMSIRKVAPNGSSTVFAPHSDTRFIGGLAFEPPTAQLTNISTRASVQTGDRVLIAGFILTGTDPKQVIVRGLGPTLGQPPFNVPNVLADPTLDLRDSTSSSIATNDNWQTAANANQIPTSPVDYRPPNSLESAILRTLQPGAYTAIMSGKNSTTGNGLVEVYDLATSTFSQLTNVSTRGFVGTGDNRMIGGFITSGGNGSTQVVVRGLGPTLTQSGVSGALADPVLTLLDHNGNIVGSNNNWRTTQQPEIQAASCNGFTCAPPNDLEAAILATVPTGNYTAILEGNGGGTGIGLVEVYKVR